MQVKDRLRERVPQRLSDGELWQLVLSSSTAGEAVSRYVSGVDTVSLRELQDLPAVGRARAARVAAVFELAQRVASYWRPEPYRVTTPDTVFNLVKPTLHLLRQEVFLSIALDSRNCVLRVFEVAKGHTSGVEVHPREVFRPLIREAASAAILVHNHPSGDPTASTEDLVLTHRLKQAGKVVGIKVLDHIIVANQQFVSLAELGAL